MTDPLEMVSAAKANFEALARSSGYTLWFEKAPPSGVQVDCVHWLKGMQSVNTGAISDMFNVADLYWRLK